MSSIPKLTKKQKKAQAFRSRRGKTSLGGKSSEPMDMEENAVPIIEDQDFVESIKMEGQEGDKKAGESVSKVVEGKKRKREQEKPKEDKEERVIEASSSKPPKTKKRKVESVEGDGAEGSGNGDSQEQASPTKKKTKESKVDAKQRFILFVGTLQKLSSIIFYASSFVPLFQAT